MQHTKRKFKISTMVVVLVGLFTFMGVSGVTFRSSQDALAQVMATGVIQVAAANGSSWNRTWGGAEIDEEFGVWGDGTCIYSCGVTKRLGMSSYGLELVKRDIASGIEQWNSTWDGWNNDIGRAVWGNGESVFTCGSTKSMGAGETDMLLVKWDAATGTQIWNSSWGGTGDEEARGICGNGSVVFTCGTSDSFSGELENIVLVKWDAATGAQIWNKTWYGGFIDLGNSVWMDGSAVYVCGTTQYMTGNDMVIVKWDAVSGTQLWYSRWGGSYDDQGFSIWGDDASVFTCGITVVSPGIGHGNLVKWDKASGAQAWNRTCDGSLNAIVGNGSFLFTCGAIGNSDASDLLLIKWNAVTGLPLWNRTWNGGISEYGNGIWADFNSILTCGTTWIFPTTTTRDALLVCWDAHGSRPVVEFLANSSSIVQGQQVAFTFNGTSGDLPVSYRWNFGDGTANATNASPVHQYDVSGTHSVTLTVTDVDGDTDTAWKLDFIIVEPGSSVPGYDACWFVVVVFCTLGIVTLVMKRNVREL